MWTDVPGVMLKLVEGEPDAATSLLHQGVDVAVVHSYTLLPRPTPANCEVHDLLEEPVLFALSPQAFARYGLAAGQKVRLARFADEPWLAPSKEFSCHEMIQRACGAAGFVPDIVAEAADFSVLVALVAADAGVALVPRMALPDGHGPISLHPLAAPVTRKIYALTRTGSARRPDIRAVLTRLGADVSD